MLFNLIRVLLFLLLSAFIVFIIRRSKIKHKKRLSVLAIVSCMLLISASGMFPVENLFVSFESPESVVKYAYFGKVEEAIYGQDSCMIVCSQGNRTYNRYIVPKSDKGYKIPNVFNAKKISHKFTDVGLFETYKVNGTQDYYVIGTIAVETDNEIGVYNGNHEKVECDVAIIKDAEFICMFVPGFSNEYYVMINGEKIFISE